jgi:hypothetical protein
MEINFWEIIKNSLPILRPLLWPFLLLAVAILAIKYMFEIAIPKEINEIKNSIKFNKGEKWRNSRDKLIWLRGLTPKEFEDYIAELFNRLGYKAYAVGGPNDGGIDVIAEKDGKKHYIQCKKYFKSREVSVGDVRDFYGALADKLSNSKAYFITTSKFTLPAEEFTGDKPIELVDGNKLLEYIKLVNPKGEEEIKSDICPKCGGILKKRDGKYGSFMGCSNYPSCRFISKT